MKPIQNQKCSNIAPEIEKYYSQLNEGGSQNEQRSQPTQFKKISFYQSKDCSKNDTWQKNMEQGKKEVQSNYQRVEKQGQNQYIKLMNPKNHQMKIQNLSDEDFEAFALLIFVLFLFSLALYFAPNQFYHPQK